MNKFIGLTALLFSALCSAASGDDYGYPIENALVATVVGTPKDFVADLPEEDDINRKEMSIVVFPDREVPDFIPVKRLNYSLVKQKEAAPLIFVIAGTGASFRSSKMKMMEKAFYQGGFHVVSISSPTYANFIMSASTTQVPGHIVEDSADIYHVMDLIHQQIKDKIDITEFHVTGYSLGASQAAFVAKLDEERKVFNFKKVLMINPPVSLYTSVSILDKMLEDNIPGGLDNFSKFYDETMRDVAEFYTTTERLDFGNDFLYRMLKDRHEKGELNADNVTEEIAPLIGFSFRIASSNMIFVSDIATNGGYILPKNHVLGKRESTTNYAKVAFRVSFTDYYDERFYPYFKERQPGLTQESLIEELSLTSIADYLSSTDKITVVHNENDIILAPGEIDFFRDTFQSRAHIYPTGGHCGNMSYKDNVDYMVNFFKN